MREECQARGGGVASSVMPEFSAAWPMPVASVAIGIELMSSPDLFTA